MLLLSEWVLENNLTLNLNLSRHHHLSLITFKTAKTEPKHNTTNNQNHIHSSSSLSHTQIHHNNPIQIKKKSKNKNPRRRRFGALNERRADGSDLGYHAEAVRNDMRRESKGRAFPATTPLRTGCRRWCFRRQGRGAVATGAAVLEEHTHDGGS